MNIAFALDPYPSGSAIDYLANEINAEVKSIIIMVIIIIMVTMTISTTVTTIVIILIFTGKVNLKLVPQPSDEAQTDPRSARCYFVTTIW